MSIESVMPSNHLILCRPFSSRLQSLPARGPFQMSQLFNQVAKVLEFQFQHQSFQWTPRTDLHYDGLVGSPCSPRDSQESSPTPQLLITDKKFTLYFENMFFYSRIVIIIMMVGQVTRSRSKRELLGSKSTSMAAKKDLGTPKSFGELQGQIE